jgi:outer membrane biosynthesis protein TonB
MRSSIIVSIILHAAVVFVGIYGLPSIRKPAVPEDIPMIVEIVPLGLRTNLPTAPKPDRKPLKKAEVKAPKPLPAAKPKKVPPPEPTPELKPKVVAAPSLEPKPIKKLKPKLKIEAKIEPKTPKNLKKAKPQRKPVAPDRFAMVLKNLEKDLKKAVPKAKPSEKKREKSESDLMARLSKSLSRKPTEFDPNRNVTISERHSMINLIKRTMEPCWLFGSQAGSKQAQDIFIEIEVALRPDGHVSRASITNRSQLQSDRFKLAAGESALRAVLNPECQPYKLPVNKYDVWKDLKLTFNPREMLGR